MSIFMKRAVRLLVAAALAALMAMAAGCGGTPEEPGRGSIDDYYVEIVSAQLTRNYERKPTVIVNFSWTNNSDGSQSFEMAFIDKAYQGGAECAKTYSADGFMDRTAYMNIKPGGSIEVQRAYVLVDESTPVQVEVEGFITYSNAKIVRTLSIDPARG